MQEEYDELYIIMMSTINKLLEDGVDLKATPALYRWSYPNHPEFEFHLLIKELDKKEQELAKISVVSEAIN